MSDPVENILQIIPADDWEAMFEDEDSLPVVCFALVKATDEEGDTTTSVRPMASIGDSIELCDNYPNYLGLVRTDAAELEDDDDNEEEE